MKRNFFYLVAASALFFTACNNSGSSETSSDTTSTTTNNTTGTLSDDDRTFMSEAAASNMAEIEMANQAQQKATNARIKSFASMLVQDHTTANNGLKDLAGTKSVTLPTAITADHQKHLDDMSKKTGATYDKDYMDMMVDNHQKSVDKYEKASRSNDGDLKAFAEKILPIIRVHLDSAKAIKKDL